VAACDEGDCRMQFAAGMAEADVSDKLPDLGQVHTERRITRHDAIQTEADINAVAPV